MASNIEVTLKRYNGTDNDVIFPTTTMSQVQVSTSDATSITDFLVTNYINNNKLGVANGVATLDGNAKITASQLPDYVVGGMRFIGSINDLAPFNNLNTNPALSNMSTVKPGSYFIVVGSYADIQFTIATYDNITEEQTEDGHIIINPGDEGDVTSPVRLESGDWIVYLGYDDTDALPGDSSLQLAIPNGVDPIAYKFSHKWAIVNNSYQNATTTEYGIVQLSSETDTTGTTNKVITESVLGGMIGTDANTIAAGDHLHDDRYYTETEVQGFFAGTTAITGYEKTNWDTAYNEKINSAAFNTADGVVTLTRQDTTTITVDLDGRYAEDILVGQVDSTAGLTVSKTGNVYTLGHADSSSVGNASNADGNVLQSMTFDTYGHVLTQSSTNLDSRYYTETEINNWLDGSATLNGDSYTPIIYGATPTSTVEGAILIDID